MTLGPPLPPPHILTLLALCLLSSVQPCNPACRYDKLVGMFSGKEVPAVGVSIGIERVFAIMEAQMRAAAEQVG